MIVQIPDGRLVIVHMQERSTIQAQKSDLCPPAPAARIGGPSQKYFGKKQEEKNEQSVKTQKAVPKRPLSKIQNKRALPKRPHRQVVLSPSFEALLWERCEWLGLER